MIQNPIFEGFLGHKIWTQGPISINLGSFETERSHCDLSDKIVWNALLMTIWDREAKKCQNVFADIDEHNSDKGRDSQCRSETWKVERY